MKDDLKKPNPRKVNINAVTQILEKKLQNKNILAENRVDSVTKEPFAVEIFKDATGWVAQARIETNGNTFLTLNYQGPRYERSNANPGIFVDPRFPQATTKVFNFLAASVLN